MAGGAREHSTYICLVDHLLHLPRHLVPRPTTANSHPSSDLCSIAPPGNGLLPQSCPLRRLPTGLVSPATVPGMALNQQLLPDICCRMTPTRGVGLTAVGASWGCPEVASGEEGWTSTSKGGRLPKALHWGTLPGGSAVSPTPQGEPKLWWPACLGGKGPQPSPPLLQSAGCTACSRDATP